MVLFPYLSSGPPIARGACPAMYMVGLLETLKRSEPSGVHVLLLVASRRYAVMLVIAQVYREGRTPTSSLAGGVCRRHFWLWVSSVLLLRMAMEVSW